MPTPAEQRPGGRARLRSETGPIGRLGEHEVAGRGRSSRTAPPLLRVPALHASGRRTGDLPGLRCTEGIGAAGSGGHRTNVDGGGRSGNDGATGAALHSVGSGVSPGSGVVPSGELYPVGGRVPGPPPGRGAPTGGTRGVQHRQWENGVAGDPSTSRSGARTFAGSPATWRLLSPRGWGGSHEPWRGRQLYGVGLWS
jgi:hypothetical protein